MTKATWCSARSSLCAAVCTLSLLAACGGEGSWESQSPEAAFIGTVSPKIDSVSVSGPGCAVAGDHRIAISGTRDTFRIGFDGFAADSTDAATPTENECTVTVVLEGAEGVAYAPAGLDLTVIAASPAIVATRGAWSDSQDKISEDTTAIDRRGRHETRALDDDELFSACTGTRTLRFNTRLSVHGNGSAKVSRIGNLRFHARPCAEADAGVGSTGAISVADAGIDATVATDASVTPPADVDAGTDAASGTGSSTPVTIGRVAVAGSACQEGTAKIDLTQGRDSFDVAFAAFSVEATAERPRRTTDCTLNLSVDVPAGKTIALKRIAVKGATALSAGSSAEVTAYYGFPGGASTLPISKKTVVQGPRTGPFEGLLEFGPDEMVFRDCARNRSLALTLSLFVRADPTAGGASAKLDSVGSAAFVVRDCP